jgi:sirohydrochlorin cobaltochelatase
VRDGLLLVGHGSRVPAGRAELLNLARLVAEQVPALRVGLGFLELSDPPAAMALDELVAEGVERITIVPLMLNPAGHTKSDVPAVVLDGQRRHPAVPLIYARPLGVDHATLQIAADRLTGVAANGLPLLLVARGTTEPEANAEAYRVARLLAEFTHAPEVFVAYSGMTWPDVPTALARCAQLGLNKVVALAWYLSTGVLVERMRAQWQEFSARTGVEVIDAGYLGPDPALVPLVLERRREALDGVEHINCDTCSYRRPFPGYQERVGQPIGVGHSHLAHEHRAHHR